MELPEKVKKLLQSFTAKELEEFARNIDEGDLIAFQDEFLAELMKINPELKWGDIIIGGDLDSVCELAGFDICRYIDFDAETKEMISSVFDDED